MFFFSELPVCLCTPTPAAVRVLLWEGLRAQTQVFPEACETRQETVTPLFKRCGCHGVPVDATQLVSTATCGSQELN